MGIEFFNRKLGLKYLLRVHAMIIYCAVHYYEVLRDGLPVWEGALDP